jgi:hypothetical protein
VSEILAHIPHSIPQILINKTPVEHANPDIVLLGDCDRIIEQLCHDLEWMLPSKIDERSQSRRRRRSEEPYMGDSPKRLGNRYEFGLKFLMESLTCFSAISGCTREPRFLCNMHGNTTPHSHERERTSELE